MRSSTTSHPDTISSRLLGPTFSKNPAEAASVLLAAGEAHAAGSLFRSSKAGVVPETAPVDDEPEQPPVPEDEAELGGLLMDEEERPPQDPLTPAPLEHPPVVIGAEPMPECELPPQIDSSLSWCMAVLHWWNHLTG